MYAKRPYYDSVVNAVRALVRSDDAIASAGNELREYFGEGSRMMADRPAILIDIRDGLPEIDCNFMVFYKRSMDAMPKDLFKIQFAEEEKRYLRLQKRIIRCFNKLLETAFPQYESPNRKPYAPLISAEVLDSVSAMPVLEPIAVVEPDEDEIIEYDSEVYVAVAEDEDAGGMIDLNEDGEYDDEAPRRRTARLARTSVGHGGERRGLRSGDIPCHAIKIEIASLEDEAQFIEYLAVMSYVIENGIYRKIV